jgi:AraC-like DNA-binding protein
MNYQVFQPAETLAAVVKCFWTLEAKAEKAPEKQRIVPDGCMEMIFHYGDLYQQYITSTTTIIQPRCFVFGQITTTLDIEPTGDTGIFAVRFHPNGFIPFANLPLQQMENKAVALADIFGDDGEQLATTIVTANTSTERIELVSQFLLNKLQTATAVDRLAVACVDLLLASNGQVSVDVLSSQLQVHRRQLERKLSESIGLSPKQLTKIIRLQATLKMMHLEQYTNLTDLAYENGYYDQAHFIKDFKAFTGMSPKQFFKDNLKLSALFIGAD